MDKKVLDQVIWDKWSAGKQAELKPSGFGWNQDTMPWKAEFKLDASGGQPFVYRAEDKYISFKPSGLWWATPQGPSVIKQGAKTSLGKEAEGKVKYADTLGAGISIEASVSRDRWRKEVTIDSLASLGVIPADAEFLEIGFEIETDFDIEGWDKKSELKFNTAIRLSELSQLESIKARDNHEALFERCDGFLREENGRLYLVKRILVGYLQQAIFPIITDTVITYGAEYPFNEANSLRTFCVALDSTHFAVVYRKADTKGYSKIGVVSAGDEIAYGDEYVFNNAATLPESLTALDSTHFVVGYASADNHGQCKVGVVSSGDEIAYGAEYEFNAANTTYISLAGLDATHFACAYRDDGGDDDGHAKIGVVSLDDQIDYGDEYTFEAADTDYISCCALDSTHFAVCYRDLGDANKGKAKIGIVSLGDEIAYGDESVFNVVATNYIACENAALDSTHFVVGYQDTGGDGFGHAKIGVVSGTPQDDIAFGDEYTFNAALTTQLSCAALDATHFVVVYQDTGGASFGESKIGTVSGDEIAYGDEYEFNAAVTDQTDDGACTALDVYHFVVVFRDDGGDDHGIARIGSLPEEAVEPAPHTFYCDPRPRKRMRFHQDLKLG